MSEMRDLYQQVILDHYRTPRNFHALADPSHRADGHNPLCGDRVAIFLRVEGEKVVDVSFEGAGCAISTASASLMTDAVKGRSLQEVRELFSSFHDLVTGSDGSEGGAVAESAAVEEMGKLAVLSGVREYPVRIKCATLPWHTLLAALKGKAEEPVTTEETADA